jgi:Uma2 family endonuclease
MNGIDLQEPAGGPAAIEYPSSDGEPMAETSTHVMLMVTLIATLRYYFRQRSDTYVIGNIFLYYKQGHPKECRSPDVMVVKGVEAGRARDSFKTWEEGAVPCFVLELTSKKTADEDQGPKRELYERLGVRDYLLFDPLGDYLPRPLVGYRLINGRYEALQNDQQGGVLSLELGIRFVPNGTELELIEFRTGQRIPTPPEAYELLAEALQRTQDSERLIEEVRQQADEARGQADAARRRAEDNQRQADEARRQADEARRQGENDRRQADEARRQTEEARREADRARQQIDELRQELDRLRSLLQSPPPPSSGESEPT